MASSSGEVPPSLSFDQAKIEAHWVEKRLDMLIAERLRRWRAAVEIVDPGKSRKNMINTWRDDEDFFYIEMVGKVHGTRGRGEAAHQEAVEVDGDEARTGTDEATGLGSFRVLLPLFVQPHPKTFRAGDEVSKRIEEGAKMGYANAKREEKLGLVFDEGSEVRIKIGSGTINWDPNLQEMLEHLEETDRRLNNGFLGGKKVMEETMIALTGQAAISLMGYYLSSSALPGEAKYVVGANAVGFVASLGSLLLREKYKRAALVLGKIGAVAASSAIVTAMTIFVPANHRLWVTTLACLLPAVAVALA